MPHALDSDDSFGLSRDNDGRDQVDQPSESPEIIPDNFSQLPYAEALSDQLSPADDWGSDESPLDDATASPDDKAWQPEDKLSSVDGDSDFLDVDEVMCREALFMLLKGASHRDIAKHFNRNERTIRRWIKKAKKRGLVRVDKLRPWQLFSEILLMIDQHRAELIDLKEKAHKDDNGPLELRCLRELMLMEEKRLRILEKVGFFAGYDPNRYWSLDIMADLNRTKVDDDYDEADDDDDEYDEEEDEADGGYEDDEEEDGTNEAKG